MTTSIYTADLQAWIANLVKIVTWFFISSDFADKGLQQTLSLVRFSFVAIRQITSAPTITVQTAPAGADRKIGSLNKIIQCHFGIDKRVAASLMSSMNAIATYWLIVHRGKNRPCGSLLLMLTIQCVLHLPNHFLSGGALYRVPLLPPVWRNLYRNLL